MIFILEAFFSGCISKVINDGKDYSWSKIKSVIKDRHDQNISTKKCRLIEKSLNIVTDNAYKNSDDLYNAIEKIFSEFKNHGDTFESVKNGLGVLGADASDQKCENFLEEFYQGIRLDDDLYKAVMLDMQQKDIQFSQEKLQKLNEKIDRNHKELVEKLDGINQNLSGSSLDNEENITTKKLKFQNNKKKDYIKNWNSRLFLHQDNNERPITLADAFIMPNYKMYKGINKIGFFEDDAMDKIIEKFINYDTVSTMLITGVPGIGKTSITSWIANRYKEDGRVILLRFRDWEKEDLDEGLLRAICATLNCKKIDLDYKVLVLEGFDEIKTLSIRDSLLSNLLSDILDYNNLKLIITSRPEYLKIDEFQNVFRLLAFGMHNIDTFYTIITGSKLEEGEIDYENLDVLGIPVILYMAIMSNIDITKKATKPELYNKIFAKRGGIFDKFYHEGVSYDNGSQILRNSENIRKYLRFLQEIAFKMFEKNSLQISIEEYDIPKLMFQGKAISVLEFPIKNLFEKTNLNIEFIHKSIYEYFVAAYIFMSILNTIDKSEEELACLLGDILKEQVLSKEIIEFLKYNFTNNAEINNKFESMNYVFNMMLQNGMTYYVNKRLKKMMEYELNIFTNMLEIMHIWQKEYLKFDLSISKYLKYNRDNELNLRRVDLRGVDLKGVNLSKADIRGADISKKDVSEKYLSALIKGNMILKSNTLLEENSLLEDTIFSEEQVNYLKEKCNLQHSKVFIKESGDIINYKEYSRKNL